MMEILLKFLLFLFVSLIKGRRLWRQYRSWFSGSLSSTDTYVYVDTLIKILKNTQKSF